VTESGFLTVAIEDAIRESVCSFSRPLNHAFVTVTGVSMIFSSVRAAHRLLKHVTATAFDVKKCLHD
jgi:hypothetical protein